MLPFLLDTIAMRERPSVLAIGAHSDDIEIGCGGTILGLVERHPELELLWVVLSATPERAAEAHAAAAELLAGAPNATVLVEGFPDAFFPHDPGALRTYFEGLKQQITPDLIFTHRRADSHQDHRVVCDLTWNVFRDSVILEYEIPKVDGELPAPNLYVPVDEEHARRKVEALMRCFPSQRHRHWFTDDLFLAMMRIRGMETNGTARYAEAFTCRKLVLDVARGDAAGAAPPAPRLFLERRSHARPDGARAVDAA